MTAAPSRTPSSDAVTPPGFRWAAAAASAFPASIPASIPASGDSPAAVSWRFPALPDAVADAARTSFGVDVVTDAEAADPRDLPAFAAIFAQARAEQIVRALARRTNLVLPAASALVIGGGAVADRLAATLGGGGSRVLRGIADPVARLRAHLAGARLVTAPWPAADLVLTTGECHAPVDPASVTGVLIDASASFELSNRLNVGFSATDTTKQAIRKPVEVREHVTRIGEGTWVVEAPGVFETLDGDDRPNAIADALVALSVLTVRAERGGRFDKLSDPVAGLGDPVLGLNGPVAATAHGNRVPEPVEGPHPAASVDALLAELVLG